MGAFSQKNRYVLTDGQDRVAFGWPANCKKFLIVANGADSSWTAQQTRDFFIQEAPKVTGLRIAGAIMPDTGSYSYLLERINKPQPVKLNFGAGPSGLTAIDLRNERYQNISFVMVIEVP